MNSNREDICNSILVVGIGNILRRDEGLGVHFIQYAQKQGGIAPRVELLDGGTAGLDLVPALLNRKKTIIIDALMMAADKPGSVYRFPAGQMGSRGGHFSLHQLGVKDLYEHLLLMGDSPDMEIIGIVPGDYKSAGIGMSPAVADAFPQVFEMLKQEYGLSADSAETNVS